MHKPCAIQYTEDIFVTPDQAELIQNAYIDINHEKDSFVNALLGRITVLCPDMSTMVNLAGPILTEQVSEALAHIVDRIHTPDAIAEFSARVGETLVQHNIKDNHYRLFGEALIAELEHELPQQFVPQVREAWTAGWTMISGIMREAAMNLDDAPAVVPKLPLIQRPDETPEPSSEPNPKPSSSVSLVPVASKPEDNSQAIEAEAQKLIAEVNNINNVARQISWVAKQTNLLSLNARIESARTGKAGAGFEVVANEVKALATRSSQATEGMYFAVNGMMVLINGLISTLNSKSTSTLNAEKSSIGDQIISLVQEIENTGKISKNISEIASETNMLALNATIEANAAGEQGKGFAVIAGEVKDLAHQTSSATNEINTIVANLNAMALNLAEIAT
ncbi:MAG: hypothetical protein JKY17_00340 [Magnetovibrio sp.]|nr:hypothetical protein [Magnetovibrio sp.]